MIFIAVYIPVLAGEDVSQLHGRQAEAEVRERGRPPGARQGGPAPLGEVSWHQTRGQF